MQFLGGRHLKTPDHWLLVDYFRKYKSSRDAVKQNFYMPHTTYKQECRSKQLLSGDMRKDVLKVEAEMLWDKFVEKVQGRDRIILELHYQEGLTLKEVGRLLGISESRVSQRRKKILAQLRKAI